MPKIMVNPDQIDNLRTQFNTTRSGLEVLLAATNLEINNIKAQGLHATRLISEWNHLQPELIHSISSFQKASDLLARAASAFREID